MHTPPTRERPGGKPVLPQCCLKTLTQGGLSLPTPDNHATPTPKTSASPRRETGQTGPPNACTRANRVPCTAARHPAPRHLPLRETWTNDGLMASVQSATKKQHLLQEQILGGGSPCPGGLP